MHQCLLPDHYTNNGVLLKYMLVLVAEFLISTYEGMMKVAKGSGEVECEECQLIWRETGISL